MLISILYCVSIIYNLPLLYIIVKFIIIILLCIIIIIHYINCNLLFLILRYEYFILQIIFKFRLIIQRNSKIKFKKKHKIKIIII